MKSKSLLVMSLALLLVLIASLYMLRYMNPSSNLGLQPPAQTETPIAPIIENMQDDDLPQQDFFLIDNSLIFVKRSGYISDYSYHHLLLDEQRKELCSVADSISGPRMKCTDESKRELFQTIIDHLDKEDLGLTGHTVKLIQQKRPDFK